MAGEDTAKRLVESPFDEASVISIHGFGDFCSTAWGRGGADGIESHGRIYFPHSLGMFYQALTQYLGFPNYGDEYKVMGLAPFGQPAYVEELRKVLRIRVDGSFELGARFFRHHTNATTQHTDDGAPCFGRLFSNQLIALLGPARKPGALLQRRHLDVARSVQRLYEEALFSLLSAVYAEHQCDALALAGGCAMNSVANGKITKFTQFQNLYVPASSGDAGGALGAALHVASRHGELRSRGRQSAKLARWDGEHVGQHIMSHANLGPSSTDQEIDELVERSMKQLEQASCAVDRISDERRLCEVVAERIVEGDIVGWFQGRMEWGPRALGNRSIVCDPRDERMRDRLNRKIKRREDFRPFAPAILREHVAEWFEDDRDVPYMTEVYQIRAAKRTVIPAVVHVDGSGRLQTVSHATNPLFWQLIHCFHRLTGVPVLLNTSFNENEPIVCRPSEALDCFLRTKMDLLVVGRVLIRRKAKQEQA